MKNIYKLPENLDLEAVLKAAGQNKWLTSKRLEKLYYVISHLNKIQFVMAKDYSKYVSLSSQHLAKIIGSKFSPQATHLLIDLKVIEKLNETYSPGNYGRPYCKQFRLCKPYWDQKVKNVPITDPAILRNINKRKSRIDVRDSFENFLFENVETPAIHSTNAKQTIDMKDLTNMKKNKCLEAIQRIEDQDYSFTRNRPDGRVYHNITSMPKELLQFLRVKDVRGKEVGLWSCEVSSTQPYILISLFLKAQEGSVVLNSEASVLKQAVLDGMVYELFMDAYTKHIGVTVSRNDMKEMFQKNFVSGRKNAKYISRLSRAIKAEFPTFFQFVAELSETNSHGSLAAHLQAIEATAIIDGVGRHVFEHRPKTVFVTRHDEVLTTEDDVKYIKDLMERKFEEMGFIKPTIKISKC